MSVPLRSLAVSHILFLAGGNGRNPISGAEHHVLTLVRTLAEQGIDTELIVLLWADDPVIQAALTTVRASGAHVRIIERRPGGLSLLSRLMRDLDCWRRLSLCLRSRGERVIHMHMELLMQVLAAWLAGCRRLVISIHNDEPHYRRTLSRAWFRGLVAAGVRFVAITDHVRQYLIQAVGLPATCVRTIQYGIREPNLPPPAREQYGLWPGDFVVGFIGRLTKQKNLPLLIRAAAQRPDVRCLIVGDGELRPSLEQLAQELGCRNVIFTGAVADAARLMPLFDVFCLPSIWEGLGVVLLEAMLQDVPIIGSRAGAIPEVLDGGTCGILIDPKDVEGLIAAIDCLRHDASTRHAVIEAARRRALSHFTTARMSSQTCSLYLELAGTAAHP